MWSPTVTLKQLQQLLKCSKKTTDDQIKCLHPGNWQLMVTSLYWTKLDFTLDFSFYSYQRLSARQPKAGTFQVNTQHWYSPGVTWRGPQLPLLAWKGQIKTIKRQQLQIRNLKEKPRGKGKLKIRMQQQRVEVMLSAKITCDGEQEKRETDKKEKEGTKFCPVELKLCLTVLYFP